MIIENNIIREIKTNYERHVIIHTRRARR